MRKFSRFLAASALGLSLAAMASASHAATVTIWIDDDGAGPDGFPQVGFDPTSSGTSSFSGTIGGFFLLLAFVAPRHFDLGASGAFGIGIGITSKRLPRRYGDFCRLIAIVQLLFPDVLA